MYQSDNVFLQCLFKTNLRWCWAICSIDKLTPNRALKKNFFSLSFSVIRMACGCSYNGYLRTTALSVCLVLSVDVCHPLLFFFIYFLPVFFYQLSAVQFELFPLVKGKDNSDVALIPSPGPSFCGDDHIPVCRSAHVCDGRMAAVTASGVLGNFPTISPQPSGVRTACLWEGAVAESFDGFLRSFRLFVCQGVVQVT